MLSTLKTIAVYVVTALLFRTSSSAQAGDLGGLTHAASLIFAQRDGTCTRGQILLSNANSITVAPYKQNPITIQRGELLQVSQGNALIFSGRSSWRDVAHTHPYPREAFILTTKVGKRVKGTPVTVESDSIKLKHGLKTTTFAKPDIATVDYLRLKPATDSFNLALEEVPWALVFYPEFYGRLVGLEGMLPVRLYDASKPEDQTIANVKVCN